MGLIVKTAPAIEPASLAELKVHLRIEQDETAEDDYLRGLVQAARIEAERITKRAIITQTLLWTFDAFPSSGATLDLPQPPLDSVTSVKYYDTAGTLVTLAAANYSVDKNREPGRIAPAPTKTWPSTQSDRLAAVEIEFLAGYGNESKVPQNLKMGVLQLAAHWYEQRESVITGTIVAAIPLVADRLLRQAGWGHYAAA